MKFIRIITLAQIQAKKAIIYVYLSSQYPLCNIILYHTILGHFWGQNMS